MGVGALVGQSRSDLAQAQSQSLRHFGRSSSPAHAVIVEHRPKLYNWSLNTHFSQGPGGQDMLNVQR